MEKEKQRSKLVSVIIPTMNSSRTLQKCLESIENQTHRSHETIVVDNLSRDSTAEVARKFNAKVILHKGGRAAARNLGIANSHGEYILFVDSDQTVEKNVLRECIHICQNENIQMITIPEVFVGDNFWGDCLALWKNKHHYTDIPRFFLKKYMSSVGLPRQDLIFGEDLELYDRLKKSGAREKRCKSHIYHIEYLSLRDSIAKELLYSRSFHGLSKRVETPMLSETTIEAFQSFLNVLRSVKEARLRVMGCCLLLVVKTYVWAIGILTAETGTGWRSS